MLQAPLPEFLHSSPIKATIQTSPYIHNMTSHPLMPENLQSTSMNSIKNSGNKSLLHNIAINFQLMPSNLQLWTSRSETKSTSTPNSYTLHVCPENSLTRLLVHTRLSPSPAHTPSLFDFWIACVPSIWSFMYCSWNLYPQVPSPTKYQLLHLWSSLRANWNLRSPKFSIPKLIIVTAFANYCT